jgi:peptide/nickel transport system permease protein
MALEALPSTRPAPGRASRLAALTASVRPALVIGLVIIALVTIGAFLIPALSPFNATQINQDNSLVGPSLAHPLGNDDLGRDVLVRVMVGYQISLAVAVGSVLLAVVIGIPLGLMAGYLGDLVDNLIMRPLDVLMAFPAILLAVVIMAVLGTGTVVVVIAIGIVYTPIIARVMRATTLTTRGELYVEAARARGASTLRVVVHHILPNSVGPVIVQASILLGFGVLLEAALSFIGLGVRPPIPSLGLMLSTERDFMAQAPWTVVAPGGALMLLVLGFNLVGDGLRDWLDPRGRARVR